MSIARSASRLASVVLVIAVAVAMLLVVGPRTGAYRTLTILSGSMEPSFGAGDVVVTTPAPTSSVRVGDVITYEAPVPGRPVVTHRVARVISGGRRPVVVTRGDANAADDPWHAQLTGDTIWRQRAVIPGAGTVIRTLRQDQLRTFTRYGVPALLLLVVLGHIWRRSTIRATGPEGDTALELEPGWEWLDERAWESEWLHECDVIWLDGGDLDARVWEHDPAEDELTVA